MLNLQLLSAITHAQSLFIADADNRSVFEQLLQDLLSLTDSEYGFIAEVLYQNDGTPYLKTHAITNIAWDEETRGFYQQYSPSGMEFYNLDTLFGAAITSAQPVIANQPDTDPRRGGLPPGHPALNAFLGIPIHYNGQLNAMVGMANRPEGYDQALIDFLAPLTTTIGQLLAALQNTRARRQTEHALAQANNLLNNVLSAATEIAIIATDPAGLITLFNTGAEQLLGYPAAEIVGQATPAVFHDQDEVRTRASELSAELGYAVDGFQTFTAKPLLCGSEHREWTYIRADGQRIPVSLTVTAIKDQDRVTGYLGIAHNISKRKAIEQSLQQTNQRFSLATDAAGIGIWEYDLTTQALVWDDWMLRLYQIEPSQFANRYQDWARFVHPEDRAEVEASLLQAQMTNSTWNSSFRIVLDSGELRYIQAFARMTSATAGKNARIIGVNYDVTERKQNEQKLIESEIRFRVMADSAPVLIWVSELDKLCSWFNQVWLDFSSRTMEQLVGNGWAEDVHPDDFERCLDIYSSHFDARQSFTMEYRLKRHDGENRWILDSGVPRFDNKGNFAGYIGSCIDITERKQAESRLRGLFDLSPMGIALNDYQTGQFLEINDALLAPTGYSREEFLALSYFEITPIEYAQQEQQQSESMVATGRYGPFEKEYIRKDGSRYPVLLQGMVIEELSGRKLIWSIIENISERKAAEHALRASETRFRDVLDAAGEYIWELDTQGLYTFVSPRISELLGDAPDAIIGHSPFEWMPTEEAERVKAYFFTIQVQQLPFHDLEHCSIHRDGHLVWQRVAGLPMFDEHGQLIGYRGAGLDISERKDAEMQLQEQAQHTQTILDNIFDGIITINHHGLITSFNHSAERIFGYQADMVIGRNVNMLMPEPYHSAHDQYLLNYLRTGVPRVIGNGCEVEGLRQNGSVFPLDLAVSEIFHHGEPVFIGVVRDITEQKRAERMKNEFVSTVSHELRTPLTAINGTLGLLQGGVLGELPELALKMITMAFENSQRLAHLINDLLDMEKIAAGKLEFNMETLALMPLIEQTLASTQAYADQFQVRFVLVGRVDDAKVQVDSQRLSQVLANYLSNAAKFSPTGGTVEVNVIRIEDNWLRIAVQDHGPGIDNAFRERIFQKFSQADSSDTRQKGGTGLGLAITKELVERMGGRVGFDSTPGQGASFYADLPPIPEPEQ
jgi:PAS domain S-box-containing protein